MTVGPFSLTTAAVRKLFREARPECSVDGRLWFDQNGSNAQRVANESDGVAPSSRRTARSSPSPEENHVPDSQTLTPPILVWVVTLPAVWVVHPNDGTT